MARRDVPGTSSVRYYFSDHLGSTSLITDALGTMSPSPLEESDYYPYGGEIPIVNNDANTYKFNGKERDIESGWDEFGARYYSSKLGRFTIPDWAAKPTDVPYANFGNPQSLNLYSYVQNNPTTLGDPDGHCIEDLCIGEGALVFSAIAYLSTPAGRQSVVNAVQAADMVRIALNAL